MMGVDDFDAVGAKQVSSASPAFGCDDNKRIN